MAKEGKVRRRSDIGERTIARMKAGRNGIVEATYRMDVVEFRVFFTMLTMISPDDVVFCEYELRVADIIRLFGLSRDGRSYETIKEAAERLVNKTMVIYHTKEDNNRYRTVIPFLTSASSQIGEGKSDAIRVTFHPELKPFLLQLKSEYLEFDVRNLAQVQSQYSIRLYMMLRHQMNLKKTAIRYPVDRLRDIFEIGENEYPLYGNFKQKVLLRACTDLNANTNIRVDEMIEERSNRKVVAVVFHMSAQDMPTAQNGATQPPNGLDRSLKLEKRKAIVEIDDPATEQLVDELHKSIVRYVSRDIVRTWLHQSSEQQVRTAVDHTLKQLKQGVVIKNVGGYLQKMVNTSLPLLFDAAPAESHSFKSQLTQEEQARQQQEAVKNAHLEDITRAKFNRALDIFRQNVQWEGAVRDHLKAAMFGTFYQSHKSLRENIENPALYGPFFQIIERLEPGVFSGIEDQVR